MMDEFIYDLIEDLEKSGGDVRAVLKKEDDPEYYYALSEDRQNLISWLPVGRDMDILLCGACYGAYCGLAGRSRSLDIFDPSENGLTVVRKRYGDRLKELGDIGLFKTEPRKLYDLVLIPVMDEELCAYAESCIEAPSFGDRRTEEADRLRPVLGYFARFLKNGGSLVFALNNSDGLRYFSGAEKKASERCFSRSDTDRAIRRLPFDGSRFYYPLPDMSFARDIFSEDRLPKEGDFRGVARTFSGDGYSLCDQEALYGRLSAKGVFRDFAPSFLVLLTGYHGEHIKDVVLMSEPGARELSEDELPIYIRYNRRRDESYRIKTEILETGKGRVVRKTALSEAANDHILSFEHKYSLLEETVENKEIHILKPRIGRDRYGLMYAEFDYIEGRTMAEILADDIKDGRAPLGKLRDALEFVMGRGLSECHDLDLVFENVLVSRGTSWLIDYEWVFDTAPDRDYVRYRILRYWYEAYSQSLYAYKDLRDFLAEFGIKGELLSDCEEKEESFQSFVNGDSVLDFPIKFGAAPKGVEEVKAAFRRLSEFTEWNLRLQDEVEEHKTAIRKLHETERLSQNHITNLENIIKAKTAENERLTSEAAYLRRHRSLYARIAGAVIAHFDRTAPQGSRKRKLLHYAKNTVRHPLTYIRRYVTSEGRLFIRGDLSIGGEFEEGGFLKLPEAGEGGPLVSIVLPAYNEVAYTYACIRSIIEHTDAEKTPYEVILADDLSTDATVEIDKYITGLRISRGTENQGFLKNCNRAAELAAGRYILFLNNDTKVTDGWLQSLTDMMERDGSIGMCGSKLIYPDGRLQEAGGIIWSDASGWNYGRLDDPDKPEYNYVKDVDYISGAAIMIRAELWKEIGGFDERYAPAYCEDSDLAFEVRKHGKRVVYQPESVVVHFEGISNGTDVEGTGLKRYQKINNEKFREKWAEELKKQQINDGSPDPFTARDRSAGKKCILVIDHYVPTWDKDAGSRTTYQYIRMFLKKGFNVKFLGDNFLHEEPYTSELEQLGVEVLYGDEYKLGIFDWIRKNAAHIDIAYLNRPHIATKYIDFLKDETGIKCIYYGHDLHFLRLGREYELTDDIRFKREAEYWKSVELSVMDRADMVYYPSEVEIEAIRKLRPDIKARAITAYTWDEFPELPSDEETREGMLFVGGFAHPPNEDAMLWFAKDIWPAIREELPEAKLYVAGSHVTEAVEELGSIDGIEILGFVSDERLRELYDSTRLVVVPLRYGAGVKGKVVEALYHDCVVVTTEVGAEGIPDADSVMAVTESGPDEASDLAQDVVKLYKDDAFCSTIRQAAASYVRQHYSMDAAWEVIKEDFT